MKKYSAFMALGFMLIVLMTGADKPYTAEERTEASKKARKEFDSGNYKDAFDIYEKLTLDKEYKGDHLVNDFNYAINCLNYLQRQKELDDYRESVITAHTNDWALLKAAGDSYFDHNHNGVIVAGKYERGRHRGRAKYANSYERDRVRALQLYEQAMDIAADLEGDAYDRSRLFIDYARSLMGRRGYHESWRLQYMTDTSELPDYEDGYYYGYYSGRSAPVDEDNKPVLHNLPDSFESAKTDGERWRWALAEAARIDKGNRSETLYAFADFLRQQFGVQTMASYGYFGRVREEESKSDSSGPYDVHTLQDDETIAKLATGIQRFELPSEFSYISLYREIADIKGRGENALRALAEIYENRRQYDEALKYWKRNIKEYGPGHNDWKQKRVDQIVNNWGRFEGTPTFPAGEEAKIGFTYRNGDKVSVTAHKIDVEKLLSSVKKYLKDNPRQLDWEKMNIQQVGWMCLREGGSKYIGKKVEDFVIKLDPRPGHWNSRVEINTQLKKAGAYLVTARMEDGNESSIVVWLHDTVIVKKMLDDKQAYFYVGDAVTGRPVKKATVEFFGYKQEATDWKKVVGRRYNILSTVFAEHTDDQGQIFINEKELDRHYQWLITATTDDDRLAYLGFQGVWYPTYYDHEYNATKVYMITDRPVYRPEQSVKLKSWVRNAKYDQEDVSAFANQKVNLQIHDAKGEKIFDKTFDSDEFGGFDCELPLPDNAALGVYRCAVRVGGSHRGGGSFRVEEYKKPEFEVKVEAPSEPIALGEVIEAKVQADYYFGGHVTKGKVKYKVTRTEHDTRWYPVAPWDWFYGNGYWWYAYDYNWYPGWSEWGCKMPYYWWYPSRYTPPEIVAEGESVIGKDGSLTIKIDTKPAKEMHGDSDHNYQITAEVVDESRRTIVGSGSVIAAREPFKVYAWVDSGHYRVGEVIHASFSARRPDQKPVAGKGNLQLLRVTYKKKRGQGLLPVEKLVQEWDLDTNDEGMAQLQMKASKAGQYRISYTVKDNQGHSISGGYIFVVRGDGFDGKEFKFNELELVLDKKDYAPGETAKLMVNADRAGGTVLLFERPANGVYRKPIVCDMERGKSIIRDIEISKKDMPNFFVEAVTVHSGKVYTQVREVIVPPEKRVLNVEVLSSSKEYKPGEKAEIKVKVTDSKGKPYKGSAVITMYDKSVEYISGGSNIGDIKEFFWKWRRRHNPTTHDSIMRYYGNLVKDGQIAMSDIGVFGGMIVDDQSDMDSVKDANSVTLDIAGDEMAPMASVRRMKSGVALGGVKHRLESAMMLEESKSEMGFDKADAMSGGGSSEPTVEAAVRKEFADTALWIADIKTDQDGIATVSCDMPENLTAWKIRTWVMGHGTVVGEGSAEVATKKNVIVRLQAPRFFVEKDEVVLSANIHNYLKSSKQVKAVLALEGGCIEAISGSPLSQVLKIDANGEERVDWRVKVVKEGEAVIRMSALTDEESDAMEMKFPVYVHGMLKTESFCGVLRSNDLSKIVEMIIPEERRPEQSRLEVRYSPTLAGAMVDALPYLANYPYGCTEQTLNRFLPTVITQKILKDMGLNLEQIKEKRTNLNAQEIGDDKERAKQWKRWDRDAVFDEALVTKMVKDGLRALTGMQLSDGGWGWFSGWGERSYPHTTAYVVHGLQIAKANGVAIVPGVLENGVSWLEEYQAKEVRRLKRHDEGKKKDIKVYADNMDAFVYMVLVDAGKDNESMRNYLYRDRTHISVYAKAMYGLALHEVKDHEKRDMIIRNIEQYLVQDEENESAWLELGNGSYWWSWYGSENEAHAYYLKLLSATDPTGVKASRLVKYLLNNRKHATYWNSTRDTALCIEAMADYLRASGEGEPNMTVEILVNGKKHKVVDIDKGNIFSFDNKLVLEGDEISSGKQTVEIRRSGTGPVYFNAYMRNFTLEDFITKAGLEVKVNRDVYKLVAVDKTIKASGSRGQVLDQKVEKYERVKLESGAELKSGDLVEVELVIDSKNDYEYLIFEDMKASGFEAVGVRSGYNGNDMGAYVEFRDEKVCFFVRQLARGKSSVSYRLRAEIPGKFSALPTRAYAMYAPELKANSDEIKLSITD